MCACKGEKGYNWGFQNKGLIKLQFFEVLMFSAP